MKILILVVTTLLLASCGQQRLAMRFVDTAASWKADDYFDLTSDQKKAVKEQLKIFLKNAYEHDDRAIPKLLERAQKVLGQADDRNKLNCGELEKIKADIEPVLSGLSKVAVTSVKTLTDGLSQKQVQYFIEQVEDKIKEDEEKLKDLSALEATRVESARDNLTTFLGRLSTEQVAALNEHMKTHPFPFAEKLKNQRSNYLRLKNASSSPEAFQKFILDYIENGETYQTPDYVKASNLLRAQNEKFYLKLICEASPKQIDHFRKKLSSLKSDFEEFFID